MPFEQLSNEHLPIKQGRLKVLRNTFTRGLIKRRRMDGPMDGRTDPLMKVIRRPKKKKIMKERTSLICCELFALIAAIYETA